MDLLLYRDTKIATSMVWQETVQARLCILMLKNVTSARHQPKLHLQARPGTLTGSPSAVLHTWHLLPFFW